MYRFRLKIEFDGRPFVGWQRQSNGLAVQEVVETAGEALSGAPTPVVGAGRTDAGVHALGMVAHIDLPKNYPPQTVKDALNAHMRPHPIAILDASEAPADFHARFSCQGREYLYRVLNRRAPRALRAHHVWQVGPELDLPAMEKAAATLIGKHDFTTFRSVQCQAANPLKTLSSIHITQEKDEVHFGFYAPSFLHNQVRSLVGSLVQVGLGRWPPAQMADALQAKDRAACGPVAPPDGLYFIIAYYP
ncbi:MAG: tRNA pseudouridine(38-40) synthase TruA [Pseudomonadota bacterium]